MGERRTMGKAMEMTPAMKAFINGETKNATQTAEVVTDEKAIDVPRRLEKPELAREVGPKGARRSGRRTALDRPGASEILDQLLVPLTIRVQHRTANALRRAHLEQRLNHSKPDTQQEIVEDALSDWLAKRGFLE